jgi:hypothetical protein
MTRQKKMMMIFCSRHENSIHAHDFRFEKCPMLFQVIHQSVANPHSSQLKFHSGKLPKLPFNRGLQRTPAK